MDTAIRSVCVRSFRRRPHAFVPTRVITRLPLRNDCERRTSESHAPATFSRFSRPAAQGDARPAAHDDARPAAHGNDDITYTLCANPGQTLQPLAKVASGGELSRVSLAIEVACLDETPTPPPTIIFDEIDTGIGGEIADTVGRLLHTLGQNRQVLCITHLPQVAAYADAHYRIEKHSDNHATQTRVTALDDEARITEIARMLGSAASDTSRDHARTMLARKASVDITPRRRPV